MVWRVLVTRPEPAATETAQRLTALGFEAVQMPLSRTVALAGVSAPEPGTVEMIAVSSANAIRHAPRLLIDALSRLACFTVGEKTAQAARQAGFMQVQSADGDAHALAAIVIRASGSGARIAYLCGKVRRPDFEDEVRRHDRSVEIFEVYDTQPLEPSEEEVAQLLGREKVDAVLVYSAASARQLVHFMTTCAAAKPLQDALFCCLSPRVAAELEGVAARVRVAARMEQEALFDILQDEAA